MDQININIFKAVPYKFCCINQICQRNNNISANKFHFIK